MQSYNHYEIISPDAGNRHAFGARTNALAFQEHDYTWEQFIRVLRKHLRFALIFAGVLIAGVLLYVLHQKDYYKPTARLEIAPPGSGINTLHEIESPTETDNQDYVETQVQILNSDALAVSVIRDLHLDKNPEFVSEKQIKESSASKTADAPSSALPGELANLQGQLDLATLTPTESFALGRFRHNLSVASVRNTRLVEISYSSQDPKLAQLATNTLVTKFIDQNYKHRYTTTMQASEWLSAQLSDLRRKVQESARAVADYEKKYGLVEVDDHDVPLSQLMNEVNRQLSEAQATRIEDEAFVRMIDEGHSDAIPALRDDKLYQDLMVRYADLRTQLVQAKTIYGDANLNVQKLQDQIAEVSAQIESERTDTIARTRSSYAAARNREQMMMSEREKLRTQMGTMSSQLTTYHMLKAEANANADLYNTLQGRLQEAGIYAGLRSNNIRVVDLASNLRVPTGPHRVLLMTLGVLGSCFFAVVLSFVRESFRNTVRTPDDVKSWTGLPSLALLPAMDRVEVMRSPTLESEPMRDLRTALLNTKAGNAPRVVLISSAMEGEGKTTVAVNFAIALAQLGNTCLLEADLRQPNVARMMKVDPKIGLTEVLNGSTPLLGALKVVAGIDNLAVLPSGTIPQSPADVLSKPSMTELLDALKKKFQYVVIDSPPVIRFSDARYLSSLADEVVLVGRYGMTTRRAMQRTTELLKEMHASVAGMVLNDIDFSSSDYHYYAYGYSSWNKRKKASEAHGSRMLGSGDDKPGAMGAHA